MIDFVVLCLESILLWRVNNIYCAIIRELLTFDHVKIAQLIVQVRHTKIIQLV